jgi:hypothetical protein
MKKMSKAMYGKSMMKTGGSATKKKVDNSFAGKLQRGLDYILGSDKLRATASSINKKLDPARNKANAQAKAINKKLDPIRDSANKKASNLNTKIQTKFGDPIRKATYGDKKKDVKKVETKKVVTKKPEVKKPIANKPVVKPITSKVEKPAAKPISKDLLDKMTRTGQGYYLDTKSGKLEKNPDINTITKKFAEDLKNKQTKKVKSTIENLKRPEIRKETIKQEVVVKPLKTNTPTVSQLWQQKTGTSWSEAKKQGLTDGSASANTALMKKLKSGSVNKNTIKDDSDRKLFEKEMNQNIQDELSGKIKFDEPVATMRRGGSVRKMRKGSITKRKK